MRILLIEDEESLSEALVYALRRNKYEVDAAFDGKTGEEMAMNEIYDVIVLDRMLPERDGVTLLKNIRKKDVKTPVIFLTAKHTTQDRIEGLDAGADDYLTKPFSNEELFARIRALSRRKSEVFESEEYVVGKSKFLPRRGEIVYGDNYSKSINLTLKETSILELLCENENTALTKEEILMKLWGHNNDGDFNIVEVFVSYLRKKINPDVLGFSIATVRGLGYKIKTHN